MPGRKSKRRAPPLGRKLRALRRAAGLTQTQVSRALDCATQAISWYETGYSTVPKHRLVLLAQLYGVSPESLEVL